jgi:fatty-acyl-CoA synthase
MAKWWLPDEVLFIEAVPKTSVGKFNKRALREQFKDFKTGIGQPVDPGAVH